MPSRSLLILGNVIAITFTIVAFAQAVSWTIAGILILVSLVIPLLVNTVSPGAQLTSHIGSKAPNPSHGTITDSKLQIKSQERDSLSSHQSIPKAGQRPNTKQAMKTPLLGHGPIGGSVGGPHANPRGVSPPTGLPSIKQGPNLNPTIAKDDYMEYDVELEAGKNFLGEVDADGLVNVYLLDEENMDNLDEGEEFWSETGEEGVETAKLEFTAQSKGKWFLVVENADDRAITVTVKVQKGTTSTTPA